ncbi:hypothetical protein [Flavobacterium sp.]|uniref:hypothetical protein n=1 Tax=Flavobacterium sp. TaxID=239 RepID=UPI0028BE1EAE|nr:hypothetical protein [Flavobacterium sp.]
MRNPKSYKFALSILFIASVLSASSCKSRSGSVGVGVGGSTSKTSTTSSKKLPPGQAKKIYGGKSAKKYAPGQNK